MHLKPGAMAETLPADLVAIMAAWPKLPENIRKAILLMAGVHG